MAKGQGGSILKTEAARRELRKGDTSASKRAPRRSSGGGGYQTKFGGSPTPEAGVGANW